VTEVGVIEVNAEDQYASVSGDVTLVELEAALPEGLHVRAPKLEITVEDWLLAGGFGLMAAPAVRRDVLGLTYNGAHGSVSIGGVVVKNVSGYDFRIVVGSDPALQKSLRLEKAILRLRPAPPVTRLERVVSEQEINAALHELESSGAAFGFAGRTGETWRVRAEFWGAAPSWGEVVSDAARGDEWRDLKGAFPRAEKPLNDLERSVLAAL
jgi:hypothetical protein